jgi:hypothetical protein
LADAKMHEGLKTSQAAVRNCGEQGWAMEKGGETSLFVARRTAAQGWLSVR